MAYLTSGRNKIMGSSVSTDANVVTVIDETCTDEQVPSALATKAYVDSKDTGKDYVEITQAEYDLLTEEEKEDIVFYIKDATNDNGLVTVIDENSTDEQVPTAKAVHTAIQNVSGGVPVNAYTKEEVDNLLDTKVNVDDLVESYSKDEMDTLLDGKANASDTYNKTEIDALLDGKANTDDVTTNGYTKEEVDNLLANKADSSAIVDAYNKEEVDGLLTAKADATALDNYVLSDELDDYALTSSVYNKTEVDDLLADKANVDDIIDAYTKTETDGLLTAKADTSALDSKINKTAIVTSVSSTSTDEEIPSAKAVHDKFQEVFQSVDNGKSLIASAITDKGVDTSNDDTFETMANNILSIQQVGVKCTFGELFDVQAPFDVKKGDVVNFNYSLGDTLAFETLCNNIRINKIGFSKSSKIMWISVASEPWVYLYKKNDTTGAWDLLCTGATLSLSIYPSSVSLTIDDKYAIIQNDSVVDKKFKKLIKIDGTEVTVLRTYTSTDIYLNYSLIFTGHLDELVVAPASGDYAYMYSINPTTYDLLESEGQYCYSTMFYKQGNTYYGFGDIYETGTYSSHIYTQKITDNGDGTYTVFQKTDNKISATTYDGDLPNKGIYYNNMGTYIGAYYSQLVAVNVSGGEIYFASHANNSNKSKMTYATKKDNKIYLFNKDLAIFNSFNLDTNQFERVDDMYTLDIYDSNGLAIFELWQPNDSPYSRYIAVNKKGDNMFYISEKGKKNLGNSFVIPNTISSEIYGDLFIQNFGIADSAKNITSHSDKSFNYLGVNYVVEKDATSGQTTQLKEIIL